MRSFLIPQICCVRRGLSLLSASYFRHVPPLFLMYAAMLLWVDVLQAGTSMSYTRRRGKEIWNCRYTEKRVEIQMAIESLVTGELP